MSGHAIVYTYLLMCARPPLLTCRMRTFGAATQPLPWDAIHPPLTWTGVSASGSALAVVIQATSFPARMDASLPTSHFWLLPYHTRTTSARCAAHHTPRRFIISRGRTREKPPMVSACGSPIGCPSNTTASVPTASCRASSSSNCAASAASRLASAADCFSSAVHCNSTQHRHRHNITGS